jgi:hypothetical protein
LMLRFWGEGEEFGVWGIRKIGRDGLDKVEGWFTGIEKEMEE